MKDFILVILIGLIIVPYLASSIFLFKVCYNQDVPLCGELKAKTRLEKYAPYIFPTIRLGRWLGESIEIKEIDI